MREQLPFFRGQTDEWAPLAIFGTISWSGSGLLPCSAMRLSAQARRARHEPPHNRACGSVSPDAKTMQNVPAGQHRGSAQPSASRRSDRGTAPISQMWTAPRREQVQDDVTTGMTIYREM